MMDSSSLILEPVVLIAGGVLILIAIVMAAAVRAAGDEIGRAALAESAPWIARIIPSLAIHLIFFRSDGEVRRELLEEIASVVQGVFENRDTVGDRVRGIFVVLVQSVSLIKAAPKLRRKSVSLRRRMALQSALGPDDPMLFPVDVEGQFVTISGVADIAVLELPGYADRALREANLRTLRQLLEKDWEEIDSIRGLHGYESEFITKHLAGFILWLKDSDAEVVRKTPWATDPSYRPSDDS